ncbi:MAG TPA: fumarylacetoacetate hydrolase family protein [Bacillus sp. (in: firmicutes)]|uniref:fumarylacetoacetate hydrolase family protein n=1 Tax=Bacillus litorisediminis TaxID=2922713 RepID=UPI001FAD449C|nr:fumarylacetoacetate hydrolase family protein [Bacillus litorisediminis]HWO77849.1 fumarylacetoacetate hydrolase family protein [Bacillus sp. (in: firmicutes)]
MDIRNIFCIGRNYAAHAAELGNAVPESPILFSKPTHALVKANGEAVSFPSNQGEIHHELEIVLYIGKQVTDGFKADDVVTKMALGIDFTLRDLQSELKKQGYPWLRAKGFKNSAIITEFWDFPGTDACKETDFSLLKNGQRVQHGNIQLMMFDFQSILEHIHREFGLEEGDIVYTGTPEGVGSIANRDEFVLLWGNEEKGRFIVSL